MTKAIAKINFDEETIQLIKNTVAVGATDTELKLFLYQAKKSGLDPLSRQIYFIKMGGRPIMMSSIDGFRVIADRSGDYAGQDEPIFIYDTNQQNVLLCCKVKVYKWHGKDKFLAATGVAFMNEYRVPNSNSWMKMPHVMLSKVAEAKALRQAFPQDLSGIYEQTEMDQAQEEQKTAGEPTQTLRPIAPTAHTAFEPRMSSEQQRKMIFALGAAIGKDAEVIKEIIKTHFKLASFNDLTSAQATAAIESLQRKKLVQPERVAEPANEEIDVDEVSAAIDAQHGEDPDWIKDGDKTPETPADPTP